MLKLKWIGPDRFVPRMPNGTAMQLTHGQEYASTDIPDNFRKAFAELFEEVNTKPQTTKEKRGDE